MKRHSIPPDSKGVRHSPLDLAQTDVTTLRLGGLKAGRKQGFKNRPPFAGVAKQLEVEQAVGKLPSWMAPATTNLPALQGSTIRIAPLDDELDAAE